MPVLTITGVNAGTNQLTIVGHGRNTGDGPGAVRSIGGAVPGGLAPVTDYWIIRDDADHVRLADSSAHAMAGTAIDITTAGSGTLVLEIGIPYRRATTYAPGVQVKSADLNAIEDALVGLHELFTGQPQTVWGRLTTLWIPPVAYQASVNIAAGFGYASANADAASFSRLPLPITQGSTIVGLAMRAHGAAAAGDITFELVHWKDDGTSEIVGDPLVAAAAPNAWANYANLFAAPLVITGPYSLTATGLLAKNGQTILSLGLVLMPA